MIVRSAMLRDGVFTEIELELVLAPGLPTIEFLGRAESSLRESEARIKSALRASGYSFPKGRRVLVDLRPRMERKHGRGLDLPIALGFLALTQQMPSEIIRDHLIYGDLSLTGRVLAPEDLSLIAAHAVEAVLSGQRVGGESEAPMTTEYTSLKSLKSPLSLFKVKPAERPKRIPIVESNEVKLQESTARLALVCAVGEHSCLMLGPAGTGKTTMAKIIHELRPPPTEVEKREIDRWKASSPILADRPFISEHHLAKELAIVGGGIPPRPGSITRAHLGTLLLDEVLLFRPQVQDALREPTESGYIDLARGGYSERLPSEFLLLGTANLCACGRFTEENPEICHCSRATRRQYDQRRRGPFMDRFQILASTSAWRPGLGTRTLAELSDEVRKIEEFRLTRLLGSAIYKRSGRATDPRVLEKWGHELPSTLSERRRQAVLRVARTLADIDLEAEVGTRHIREARAFSLDPFVLMTGGNA